MFASLKGGFLMVMDLPCSPQQHKKHQMVIAQVMVEALKYLHIIQKGI